MKLAHVFLALAAAALVSLATADARANGRFPASNAIAFDPSDPARVYLRTTFGLLVSSDAGHAWDWVCERSLGFSGPEDPAVGVFAEGSVAIALFGGLSLSHDRACGFSFLEGALAKKVFVDLSVQRSDATRGLAITSGFANRTDDAGAPLFSSELFATNDAGRTWKRVGAPLDPTLLLTTVDVSATRPQRLFLSATRGSSPNMRGVLLVSDDGGLTFKERPIALTPKVDRAPFIAALDPADPDVLWVRVQGNVGEGGRLLYSKDAGATFQTALQTTGPMRGFALSDDGKVAYAGGPKDGVWRGDAKSLAFEKQASLDVQCLAYARGELWACASEASGFTAGVSRDQGKTWEARAHLRDVRGPLDCPRGSRTAELCAADWPQQRATLGIDRAGSAQDAGLDAGGASLGDASSAAPSAASPTRSSCSCDTVGARGPAQSPRARALMVLAVLVALVAQRRRRR